MNSYSSFSDILVFVCLCLGLTPCIFHCICLNITSQYINQIYWKTRNSLQIYSVAIVAWLQRRLGVNHIVVHLCLACKAWSEPASSLTQESDLFWSDIKIDKTGIWYRTDIICYLYTIYSIFILYSPCPCKWYQFLLFLWTIVVCLMFARCRNHLLMR